MTTLLPPNQTENNWTIIAFTYSSQAANYIEKIFKNKASLNISFKPIKLLKNP